MYWDFLVHIAMACVSTYLIHEYYTTFFKRAENVLLGNVMLSLYFIWQALSITTLEFMPAWVRLCVSIIFVIVVALGYQGGISGKTVFAIIYNAIWMLSELLIGGFFLLVGLSVEKYELLGSVISKLFLLVLIKLLQRFFRHENVNVLSLKENAMLMTLPIGSMFFTHHLFTLSHAIGMKSYIIISVIAFFVILLVNAVMFAVYIKLSASLELKRQNSIFQLEIELYGTHIKEKENAMLEFKKSKHDLKNKLIFLLDLLQDKKYSEMQAYIEELIDLKSLDSFTLAQSGNSLIDALINYKYETAKQHNITFNSKLNIPIDFSLANADLCVILGNAIDNALEANINKVVENPFVDLRMKFETNK